MEDHQNAGEKSKAEHFENKIRESQKTILDLQDHINKLHSVSEAFQRWRINDKVNEKLIYTGLDDPARIDAVRINQDLTNAHEIVNGKEEKIRGYDKRL